MTNYPVFLTLNYRFNFHSILPCAIQVFVVDLVIGHFQQLSLHANGLVNWFDCKNENENAALNAAAAWSAQMASTFVDSVELTASFCICTDREPTFSFYNTKLKLCSQAFNDIGRIPQFDCSVSTMKPVCCRSNSLLCMGESLKEGERDNGKASRKKTLSCPLN